jgi:hypothetical protein
LICVKIAGCHFGVVSVGAHAQEICDAARNSCARFAGNVLNVPKNALEKYPVKMSWKNVLEKCPGE